MTTTTNTDVNPPDQFGKIIVPGGKGRVTVGGKGARGADEHESRDHDRDMIDRADQVQSEKVRAIARRQSMPNGEWAIRGVDDLRSAVQKFLNPPDKNALSSTYGAA